MTFLAVSNSVISVLGLSIPETLLLSIHLHQYYSTLTCRDAGYQASGIQDIPYGPRVTHSHGPVHGLTILGIDRPFQVH